MPPALQLTRPHSPVPTHHSPLPCRSAYKTLTTIESRASDLVDDLTGGEAQNGVSLIASATSLALVKLGGGECGTGLSRQGAGATQLSQCPAGTELEANRQRDADTPAVFVAQVGLAAAAVGQGAACLRWLLAGLQCYALEQ